MFKKFYFLFLAIVASISLGVVAANAAPVTFLTAWVLPIQERMICTARL